MKDLRIISEENELSTMTVGEFKEQVDSAYAEVFPISLIYTRPSSFAGYCSIFIDCFIVSDKSEEPNSYFENDMFNIKFNAVVDDGRTSEHRDLTLDTPMPERVVLEVRNSSFKIKPESDYYAFGRHTMKFRKVTGTAEKVVSTLAKYFKQLKEAVIEEYNADNLMPNDKIMVEEKLNL